MIGTGFSVPMTARGSRPPVRLTKLAPICSSGVVTRAIGRLARLASPVKKVVIGWLATRPIIRRAAVPLLPMSSTWSASTRPPMPTPRTRQTPSSLLTMSAPSARMAAAVWSTSSPVSRPWMVVSPIAMAPNISARWEIDLSPGTRTVPDSGPVLADWSGLGAMRLFPLC